MKRGFSLLLAVIMMISLTACDGNFESVDLNDPIAIPQSGIIEKGIIDQIKMENAIGVFTGTSGDFRYEWTVFGSDIEESREISFGVELTQTGDNEIKVVLSQNESFGFSALLSVYLNEQWIVSSANAYANEKVFASVSLTGSKASVLNLSLDGTVKDFVIRGEEPETEKTVPDHTDTETEDSTEPTTQKDDYLSKPGSSDSEVYNGGKDKYLTDPVPEGKPQPVEPEDQEVDKAKTYTCTFSIECSTILNNLDMLDPDKLEMVPSGGVILAKTTVTFYEGESVYDVLQRVCRDNGIHMEASWTPIYNSAYVEGIHNLYEFDCGALSGWMYKVNGWYPNYGSSRYQLKEGDLVEWRYTCDLGNDVGGAYAVGG